MAILKTEEAQIEVPDGEQIKDAAEKLGIPFGCCDGLCRSCQISVIEGMEFLSDKTEAEEDADLEVGERFCCQMSINGGEVLIKGP
jgi:ferredoxin